MLKALISSVSILTSIKSAETSANVDLSSILHAELTCCAAALNGDDCAAMGPSSCIWIDSSSTQFAQDLAAHDGKACVGQSYLSCKEAAQDVDACCAPGCVGVPANGPPVPAPPPGVVATPPNCFLRPPTEEPTPQPIEPPCTIGVDYTFEGVACQISGDPHDKTFNGYKHDFQGQPTQTNLRGDLLNQFYYATTCDGSDTTDMPFRILGTHHHWGTRPVSGIDYLTIELFDDNGKKYNVYLNHAIGSYALRNRNPTVSTNYDDTPSALITDLISNTPTALSDDSIFTLTFTRQDSNRVSLKVAMQTVHGVAELYIYMAGQMDIIGRSRRMHYVYIKQDSLFKCHTCGLCGDFKQSNAGNMELCDGSFATVRPGWNAHYTPEAYDLFGWTYEKNYWLNDCSANYDITDNTDSLHYVDPCDATIADSVKAKCAAEVQAYADCCANTLGGTVCADMQADCEFDACVIATDNGKTEAAQNDAVDKVLGAALELACGIPDVGNDLNAGNLDTSAYKGCYKDDSNRVFDYAASMNVPNFNVGECANMCWTWCGNQGAEASCYMGLQYGKECFCGISLEAGQSLGEQTNKAKCSEFQSLDPPDQAGCWGGGWTMCLYQITGGNTQNAMIMSVDGIRFNEKYAFMENGYIQMGMIGAVVVLIGGVWYIKRNKDDKYIPIDGQTSKV